MSLPTARIWWLLSAILYLIIESSLALTPTIASKSNVIDPPSVLSSESKVAAEVIEEDLTMFQLLARNVANCLIQSDFKRLKGNDGASTGWTSWVDDAAAYQLKNCMDRILLSDPAILDVDDPNQVDRLQLRDDAQRWTRWMKNIPAPLVIELSFELRQLVNETVDDITLERLDSSRQEFLDRAGCRVILLPSGQELDNCIRTPAGAMAYGKLLYGGVTRYRLIGSNTNLRRKAGERTEIYNKASTKSWMQYGGPERTYQSVEMGPCALLECLILPKGIALASLDDDGSNVMTVANMGWNPNTMLDFRNNQETTNSSDATVNSINGDGESSKDYFQELESSFSSKVGGLTDQVDEIVRRVLDGRVIQPASSQNSNTSVHGEFDKQRQKEAKILSELGLKPVKGLLLYGPPGTGKTLLAREISVALDARPPKIVSAPDLLDRWVGGSEKLVRSLFAEAQQELKACNNDPTRSALHIIVIDEIDAVFRQRSSNEDSAAATRASAVNQMLSLLDGMNVLENVLVIGLTNRRELLDDALLRPGRLEVQIEIPLPTRQGRREILQIHFDALRRKGRLSQPLCIALDGGRERVNGDASGDIPKESFWRKPLSFISSRRQGSAIRDLAAETRGYSGADLAGLVRSAGSLALARARQDGGGVESLLITVEDVANALQEVYTVQQS